MSLEIKDDKPYTIDKTPSMKNTLNTSVGQLFNSNEQIGDKLVKIILSLINTSVDLGIDMTLGRGVTEKTINELKTDLLNKLVIIKELAKDPIIQEKVGEASRELVSLSLETIENVEKPLNDIVDMLLRMISETTNKTVRGSLETARGVAQSALAEIPVVGGLVDLILTAGVAFNRVGEFVFDTTSNVLEGSQRIGTVLESVSSNAQKAYKTYDDAKTQIKGRIQNIQDVGQELQDRIGAPIQNLNTKLDQQKEVLNTMPFQTQRGGRKKNIEDLITRISKRLASVN